MKEFLQKHKQYLLTGVSYVIPFIACGGILLAVAITLAFHFGYIDASGRPDFSKAPECKAGIVPPTLKTGLGSKCPKN